MWGGIPNSYPSGQPSSLDICNSILNRWHQELIFKAAQLSVNGSYTLAEAMREKADYGGLTGNP